MSTYHYTHVLACRQMCVIMEVWQDDQDTEVQKMSFRPGLRRGQ